MKNKDKQYFISVDGELIEVTEEVPANLEHPLPRPEKRRVPLHQGPALEM